MCGSEGRCWSVCDTAVTHMLYSSELYLVGGRKVLQMVVARWGLGIRALTMLLVVFAGGFLALATKAFGSGMATVTLSSEITSEKVSDGGFVFFDTATLQGTPAPTGVVTFKVYGPGDETCAAAPLFTSSAPASAAGSRAVSGTFSAESGAGTYRLTVEYGGDATYAPTTSKCGAQGGAVDIPLLPVSIATQATTATKVVSESTLGAQDTFFDTATLSGVPSMVPTGTVTFDVYYYDDLTESETPTCTGTPLFTSTNVTNEDGVATSNIFTSPAGDPGTYQVVASYNGDKTYASGVSECALPNDAITVPMVAFAARGGESDLQKLPPELGDIKVAKLKVVQAIVRRGLRRLTISYVVSRANTVTITLTKLHPACKRGVRRCVPSTMIGRVYCKSIAGYNSIRLDGKIGREHLTPGLYRAMAYVDGVKTAPGEASTVVFRIR